MPRIERARALASASTIRGMRTKWLAVIAVALVLTGCSASKGSGALDACKAAAEDELGASIDLGDLEATNMGDALFDAGIKDERDTGDDDALFTVAGEFTYETDGTETRKSMLCTVKFEDGQPGAPDLNIF